MYISYEEYKLFGGTLDETDFSRLVHTADALINFKTFNRLRTSNSIPVEVKELEVHLIQLIDAQNQSMMMGQTNLNTDNIIQQSNDGVSIQYNTMSAMDINIACGDKIDLLIHTYLTGVRTDENKLLLYRGFYPGE